MMALLHRRIEAALPAPASFLEYLASQGESWLLMLFLEATHEGSILGEDLPLKARQFDPCLCIKCTCLVSTGEPTREATIILDIDDSRPRTLAEYRRAINAVIT